jgi:hypothetical protein
MDDLLNAISTNIFPLLISIIGLSSGLLTKAFIKQTSMGYNEKSILAYAIVGQSIVLSPMSTLIAFIREYCIGKILLPIYVLGILVYLSIYVCLIFKYLAIDPIRFAYKTGTYYFYKIIPILFAIAAILITSKIL